MNTDPFVTAVRAEAESWIGMDLDDHDNFVSGAEWARTHLAAQEPTEGEIEAAALMICIDMDDPDGPPETKACKACINIARRALDSVRAARRDEERS